MRSIDYKGLRSGILGAYENLENNKEYVNGLNVFPVPDGDTGTNMTLTMKSVVNQLNNSNDNMKSVSSALAKGSLMGARGNSGVILSQLLRGFAKVFEKVEKIEIINLVEAFESAKDTAYKAVLKPTEGTILTVSRMMAEFARREFLKYDKIDKFLEDIISEGKNALSKTPEMLPVLKEAGVVDAGGQGFIFILEGIHATITGKELSGVYKLDKIKSIDLKDEISHHSDVKPEDIKFGYCTEFLIFHDGNYTHEEFKKEIESYGDSLVIVGSDDIIKTHIHTDDPGKVLSLARSHGELSDIKIENMRFQNAEVNRKKDKQNKKKEKKKYGFVVISIGEGFNLIFDEFGVDRKIEGGQTMNPSTEDIVKAVEDVNAENVFVFPNNKNIILAAKQASEIVDCNLIVIETRSIPESFVALMNFDETKNPDANYEQMTEAFKEITSLQVTYAVRDTKSGEIEIKKDDIIGIKNDSIVTSTKDLTESILNLVSDSVNEDSSLLSLYYGEDVTEEEAETLRAILEVKYPLLDVEMNFGGQPLYYYIGSVE